MGKYVECKNCQYFYECAKTYLFGCTHGKEWGEDEEDDE